MELYGSLLNISGSVTASAFTGSFIGDGSGLSGIQASGVTGLNLSQIASGDATASITTSGFTVNKNTQIQGNLSVTGALIANEYIVSSSVIYMTTSFASGSSAFGNDNNDVHQFTGSVQITGSISLNGQAIGTGKLDETTFQSYTSSNNSRVSSLETSSGSLNSFTSSINTTIKSKLDSDNVISGSVQVNITGTTGYSTFSSSISNSIDNLSSSVATTTSGLTSTITSLSSSLTSSIGSLSSSIATIDLNQDNRLTALETSSGSLNSFTSSIDTTIKNKLNNDGVISGSSQILNGSNLVSSSTQVTAYGFATTGSNLFKGTQTHSGSILPSVDNAYDLGSTEYQWRDVYISSGSLYIDGTKVLSSTAQELVITTDSGQSIKILEGTTDSIILQTADGDIELKSSADGDILLDPTNGKIMLKGPVEVLSGQKIQSSVGGTPVVFANDIVVSGSIDLTGTIEGIDLTTFSSSVNTRLANLETSTGSLNSYTSSNTTNINTIHTATSSLNSFTSSINTTIKSKLDNDGVISGSVQVILTGTTGYSTFSSSVSTSIGEISGSIATTTSGLSSTIGSLSSSVATTTSGLSSTITSLSSSVSSSIGSLSSSVATTTSELSSTITSLSSSVATTTSGLSSTITSLSSSVATYNLGQDNRLTSIEGKTGSYATTGSNIFQGDQTITGSLYVSQNLIIAGSSSIQHISSSVVNIADNIITVNAQNPSIRFGGLAVIDSGSSPQVSGSMLFDSTNDQWIFVHQNQAAVTSSVLLMGPQTINNLGNESYPTTNRVLKSVNAEHVGDSNITDDGTTVTVLSNTIINGTISATGTTLVSGSAQISHDSTTGYVANRHIDHTAVSITAGNGLSGGGDISATRTVTLDTGSVHFLDGVKKELNTEGVISGSSQVLNGSGVWSGSAQLPSGVVSGSSQVLSGTGIWSGSAQLPSGVVSGSSQISFGSITGVPSGLVSGSSQVLAGTTIHSGSFFNGISVVSGSAQISFNGITDKPTLVSGSSQISFGSISGVPGGLVSGSSQIDLTATTNYSTGIKTRLNAEGVLSGSAQVVAALPSGTVSGSVQIIAGLPSGTVSGSAQITLSSTTGYGSVLNQAVLTTSSPTFAGLTLNGAQTISSGGSYPIQAISTQRYIIQARNSANSINTNYGWWWFVDTNFNMGFHADGAADRFTLTRDGNLSVSGTISASNFSGTSSGTNTGDQTLSGLGGLSNNTDSEQIVGLKEAYWNYGGNRMYTDPRWNESGYDTDLGTLHIYSSTAAGASYGRAGIALYNGSAYQYLTTKASTTGLFANNSLILTAGNYTSYAMSGAGYSANQNLNTTSSPTFVGLTLSGTLNISGGASGGFTNSTLSWVSGTGGGLKIDSPGTNLNIGTGWNENIILNTGAGLTVNTNNGSGTYTSRFTVDRSGNISNTGTITTSGGIYLTDSSAALYRDNSYDVVLTQNGSSGGVLYLGGAGNVIVSIDNNNNETDRKFIVGSNAVKASNELFSVNESGNGYFSGTLQAVSTLYVGGTIVRTAGGTGYLNGGYSSAETGSSTGAIYTIGGSYYPTISSLNNMYGIGYTNTGGGTAVQMTNASGWGMYVVANGTPYVWLGAEGNSSVFRGNILPHSNNSHNLGSASYGWANVYTNDLHLSNMNKPEGNDIDGTNGNWTIQEGAENLYIINNNNGKKFKIKLEEI